MNPAKSLEELESGEGQTLEFKKSLSQRDRGLKALCGMINAEPAQGAVWFGVNDDGELVGIMGIEPIKDVTLIRHAYVLPEYQNRGIGKQLLTYLINLTTTRQLLVGTWGAAYWALAFYHKNGFTLLPDKDKLLSTYWDIPPRQIETSVVMGIEVKDNSKE